MASGDSLFIADAASGQPPAANYATLDTRNSVLVLDFDAGTDEAAVFVGVLPRNYAGGGLTLTIHWAATSATSGDVVWAAQIERANTDLDADSFATAQTATGTANGTSGILTGTAIAFTSGANMDSLAAGEPFRLKVYRDADAGGDTATGDAELVVVELKET